MSRRNASYYNFAIKAEFYPNHQQVKYLLNNIHTSRYVYNQLIANSFLDSKIHKINQQYPIPKEYWKYNKKKKVIKKSQKRPTELDHIMANKPNWMFKLQLDSDMFNNTLVNYKAAWNMFRKVNRAGTPKFKCRDKCTWSYTTSNHYDMAKLIKRSQHPTIYNGSIRFIDNHHLYAGRILGILVLHHNTKLPKHQQVRISNVTFRYEKDGHWFVSILFKSLTPFKRPLPKTNKTVGIDLNLNNFMADSNGLMVENPKCYRHVKTELAKQQRILSRRERRAKKEGRKLRTSKNYQQQRRKVAALHRHIRNQRRNFLNYLSTAVIKNHDFVVTENLLSKNMLKNHALAISISDVGWRTFIIMLKYKAKMYDKTYVLVNPRYTTQICHNCGYRMGSDNRSHKLTLNDRSWICPQCHKLHIRDINAAINILNKGLIKYQHIALHNQNVYD